MSKILNTTSKKEDFKKEQKEEGKQNNQKVKKDDRELSAEERIMGKEIQAVEKTSLNKVFALLCSKTQLKPEGQNKEDKDNKDQQKDQNKEKDYFTAKDISMVLADLDYPASKLEIEQMIWEIDENLNGRIDHYEFELMYKRCSLDESGLEPRSLYNVVQFLMFLQSQTLTDEDSTNKQNKKKITSEDTLELLYVRYGRSKLDQEIEEIFGENNMRQDGQEKQISLSEYLQKIKKKDYKFRKAMEKKRRDVDPLKGENKNDDYYYSLVQDQK